MRLTIALLLLSGCETAPPPELVRPTFDFAGLDLATGDQAQAPDGGAQPDLAAAGLDLAQASDLVAPPDLAGPDLVDYWSCLGRPCTGQFQCTDPHLGCTNDGNPVLCAMVGSWCTDFNQCCLSSARMCQGGICCVIPMQGCGKDADCCSGSCVNFTCK